MYIIYTDEGISDRGRGEPAEPRKTGMDLEVLYSAWEMSASGGTGRLIGRCGALEPYRQVVKEDRTGCLQPYSSGARGKLPGQGGKRRLEAVSQPRSSVSVIKRDDGKHENLARESPRIRQALARGESKK